MSWLTQHTLNKYNNYDSVEEAEKFLRDSYNKAEWRGMGNWNDSGCIPEHYILPKYKDIVAD